MIKYLQTTILLVISFATFAQGYNPEKVNKKAAQLYSKAIETAESGNYREAITILDNAIAADKNFVDAYLSKAGLFGELKNYTSAIENYEKAFGMDLAYTNEYKLP